MPAIQDASRVPWKRFSDSLAGGRPAVLPIGSFEQHGPHLPLGTDTIIIEAIAAAIAAELPAIALPALPYGAPSRPRSGGGDLFPAPALPLATLLATVTALARDTIRAGCRSLIVVSWHWENAAVLWDALLPVFDGSGPRALLIDNPADLLAGGDRDALFPEGFPGWESEHAGRLETALVSYLAPELVGDREPPTAFSPRPLDVLPTPADAVPANGVFFDPGDVDAAVGERCFRTIVASLVALVRGELGS